MSLVIAGECQYQKRMRKSLNLKKLKMNTFNLRSKVRARKMIQYLREIVTANSKEEMKSPSKRQAYSKAKQAYQMLTLKRAFH